MITSKVLPENFITHLFYAFLLLILVACVTVAFIRVFGQPVSEDKFERHDVSADIEMEPYY